MNSKSAFKHRINALVFFYIAWAVIAIGYCFYYAVIMRNHYVNLSNKMAMRRGEYSLSRAKILDKNGILLAWTEKYYDLIATKLPTKKASRLKILKKMRDILPDYELERLGDGKYLLHRALMPDEITKLIPLLRRFPYIKVVSRQERCTVSYPEVKKFLGKTVKQNGQIIGDSNIELKYNKQLNGTTGIYSVMVDRRSRWVKGSWLLIKKATPGKDVKLNISLEEIRNNLKKDKNGGAYRT